MCGTAHGAVDALRPRCCALIEQASIHAARPGNEATQFNAQIAAAHLVACAEGDGATLSVRGVNQ